VDGWAFCIASLWIDVSIFVGKGNKYQGEQAESSRVVGCEKDVKKCKGRIAKRAVQSATHTNELVRECYDHIT